MDTQKSGSTQIGAAANQGKNEPRSLKIAETGIQTGADFANLMSALMSDIVAGRVTPQMGNATCSAGAQLLKVVAMQYRYGKPAGAEDNRVLMLAPGARDAA